MFNVPAKFKACGAKVVAKLSTGEEIGCTVTLEADGLYSSWWEYPCEPQHGSVNYTDYDIDESSITILYPDEWEFIDENKQKYLDENINAFQNVRVVEIVKFLDTPDWEVDENSLEDEYDKGYYEDER